MTRWRVIPGQLLACRGWIDEYVLYNDLSGDTHLLGADAVQVLAALKQAPASEQALAASLGAADALAVAALLADLNALYLVEPLPC
jgi:PqqD family protein of HPr-rel-A system